MPLEPSLRVIVVDDESIARQRLLRLLRDDPQVVVAAECACGAAAVQAVLDESPDLMLLDIQMPEMDGFGVLRRIPSERMPLVVFVTAHDQHAIAAFEANALDYLLKPFRPARFQESLARARDRISAGALRDYRNRLEALARASEDRILVRSGDVKIVVGVDEVDWVEAADNYICIHAGATTHMIRNTLGEFERRWGAGRFIRIHKSTLVNGDRIRQFSTNWRGLRTVILRDGTTLGVGRSYRDRLDQFSAMQRNATTNVDINH